MIILKSHIRPKFPEVKADPQLKILLGAKRIRLSFDNKEIAPFSENKETSNKRPKLE